MFDWMAEIGDMIATICDYVLNLISSIMHAIPILMTASSFPLQMIGWMPVIIGTSITIVVAIAILKLIIGWGNS